MLKNLINIKRNLLVLPFTVSQSKYLNAQEKCIGLSTELQQKWKYFSILKRSLSYSMLHNCKDHKNNVSSTTIMVQDGLMIQELPCIVQIINGEFNMYSNGRTSAGRRYEGLGLEVVEEEDKILKNINIVEEQKVILEFLKCKETRDVYIMLDTLPHNQVTPNVAVAVMRRMMNLQRKENGNNIPPEESQTVFSVQAITKRLFDIVINSKNPNVIIEALKTVSRDMHIVDKKYVEPLCLEAIVQISEGKLSILQVCNIARSFTDLQELGQPYLEKCWVGITDKARHLTVVEITSIIAILPHVQQSRSILYNFIEKKAIEIWYELNTEAVTKILQVLVHLKIDSDKMLSMISKWVNVNTHLLTEGELRWIVYAFLQLNYTDSNFQRALARYMKAKRSSIMDPSVVGVIMDYCVKTGFRSTEIMNSASEYFIKKSKKLSVPLLYSIFRGFGILNFRPANPAAFYIRLEHVLDQNFSRFPPDVIVDLMLCCVYLERYPINYIHRIFSPYFFNRMNKLEQKDLRKTYSKLKVLDIALTLEVPQYKGPKLPHDKNNTRSIWRDARIIKCIQNMQMALIEIAGNSERITHGTLLSNFPGSDMYIVDCVVDMSGRISPPYFKWDKNKYALLVHLPEHYTIGEKKLVGPQIMRERHLKRLGYKVVGLDYVTLTRFKMYPEKIKYYIQSEMSKMSND